MGAVAAVLTVSHHLAWPVAVVLCLLVGAAAGSLQGFLIAYLGIPSFIVTLAGMLLFRGLTEILLKGQTLGPFPDGVQKFGNGFPARGGPAHQLPQPDPAPGPRPRRLRGLAGGARPAAASRSSPSMCCPRGCSRSSSSRWSPRCWSSRCCWPATRARRSC
ncbi:hypothetical protein ACFPC0_03890 [Streptomyces andamanensis]|uniref:Xylose transport system permease protein XylH n=1 Tax=Streptomyces andamanensis TaxID=1565035 RepID=A0ABV8T8R7_9ACTN